MPPTSVGRLARPTVPPTETPDSSVPWHAQKTSRAMKFEPIHTTGSAQAWCQHPVRRVQERCLVHNFTSMRAISDSERSTSYASMPVAQVEICWVSTHACRTTRAVFGFLSTCPCLSYMLSCFGCSFSHELSCVGHCVCAYMPVARVEQCWTLCLHVHACRMS